MAYPLVSVELEVQFRGRRPIGEEEPAIPPDSWAFVGISTLPNSPGGDSWVPYISLTNTYDPEKPWVFYGGFAAEIEVRGGDIAAARWKITCTKYAPDDSWGDLPFTWIYQNLGAFSPLGLGESWILAAGGKAFLVSSDFSGKFATGSGFRPAVGLRPMAYFPPPLGGDVPSWEDLTYGEWVEGVETTAQPTDGVYPNDLPPPTGFIEVTMPSPSGPTSLPAPVPLAPEVGIDPLEPVILRWQDDIRGWGLERIITLGQSGDRFPCILIHRLGVYRTRQWELSCSSSTVIVSIEEEAEVIDL